MEQLKEIFKKRTTWLIIMLLVAAIIIIYFIKRRKNQNHESSFRDMVREEALKNKLTEKELELNQYMRKLWADNTFWMRNYMISYMNNSSDLKDVTRRLLKNQDQIGRSFGLWYSDKVGQNVSKMLQTNLISYGNLLKEMSDKNANAAIGAEKKWDADTEKLVKYMSSLNGEWDQSVLLEHFKKYNQMNITQAMNKFKRKHTEEIEAFDQAYQHAMYDLADYITNGIVKQHPDKFDKTKSYSSSTEKNVDEINDEREKPEDAKEVKTAA